MDDEDRRAFSGSVRKPQPSVLFNRGADLNVLTVSRIGINAIAIGLSLN